MKAGISLRQSLLHKQEKEKYKKAGESQGGMSEERLATAPRPYSSPAPLPAHNSGSQKDPT